MKYVFLSRDQRNRIAVVQAQDQAAMDYALDKLDRIFKSVWNGQGEDAVTAWNRVLAHVEAFQQHDEFQPLMIKICKVRLAQLAQTQKSWTEVTPSGKIIHITQIGGAQ